MSARTTYVVRVEASTVVDVEVQAETEQEALEAAEEQGFEIADVVELSDFKAIDARPEGCFQT